MSRCTSAVVSDKALRVFMGHWMPLALRPC